MVDRESGSETYTAATFEPVRVRRASNARSRLVTAAWLVGLAGVAGLALVGRFTETAAPDVAALAVVSTPAPIPPPRATSAPLSAYPLGMHHLATLHGAHIIVISPLDRARLGDDGLVGGLVFSGG